jgi:hypothetical protein
LWLSAGGFVLLKGSVLAISMSCIALPVLADAQSECPAGAGSLLTGTVASEPRFAMGKSRRGTELSHTHFSLKADGNGRIYDVAVDNVFAGDYVFAREAVPASLSQIHEGMRLELCGQLYTRGVGIHWVHTNCGDRPTKAEPDGWLKIVSPDGSVGPQSGGKPRILRLVEQAPLIRRLNVIGC